MKSFRDKLWDKTGLSFWEDYTSLFNPIGYNWINYSFIYFDIEWDKTGNELVIELSLLGLHMRWQKELPGTTPEKEMLSKRIKDLGLGNISKVKE